MSIFHNFLTQRRGKISKNSHLRTWEFCFWLFCYVVVNFTRFLWFLLDIYYFGILMCRKCPIKLWCVLWTSMYSTVTWDINLGEFLRIFSLPVKLSKSSSLVSPSARRCRPCLLPALSLLLWLRTRSRKSHWDHAVLVQKQKKLGMLGKC